MTTIIRELIPAEDWPYVKVHAWPTMCVDTCGLVAVDDETGEHYGAVVFDHFNNNSARAHVCVTNPIKAMRAGLLSEVAEYAFNHKNRGVVFGFTAECNEQALRFLRRTGWRQIGRLHDGHAEGIDQIISEMRKESCQWLEREPEQPVQLDLFDEVKYGR